MGHSELSADITRSDTLVSKFHNTLSDHVRQGPAVDEDPAKLINSSVTCKQELFIVRNIKISVFQYVFLEILLSNLAHPLYHCRRGLFSGGRTLTSNGLGNEVGT